MQEKGIRIVIGLIAAASGALTIMAATGATPGIAGGDRVAIERVVHDYILAHPEIIPEAMDRLKERETAQAIAEHRSAIETPFAGAWEGSADPDVTLVEFFDYACGYCRASLPDIARLLKDDPKLRIVYREFPVLTPDSDVAARVSLAAAKVGKYAAFHRALFAAGKPDARNVAQVAATLSIDTQSAASDDSITRELTANRALMQPLSINGTPAWVVGDKSFSGAVGYDDLKTAIADVRAGR